MATDKKLSSLVESQLPSYLLDEGPNLVAFVKAYYEWLETNGQATDALKNLIVNQDIDTTDLGKFYDFFRREVLSEFPGNILANKKLVAKRIKDLYVAKGSRQAHRLLFRLLFNEEIDFYNPSDNILRTSDGRWSQENSIRLGAPFNGILEELENEVVTGNTSGASAKVASVITTFESGIEVKELFLIEISGTFRDLETVSNADGSISGIVVNTVGPLRDVTFPDVRFTRGGAGHQPGDRVSFTSLSGSGANGVVVSTSDLAATLSIINGGSGYRVSNTVITITGGTGSGLSGIVTSVSNTELVSFFNDTINELKDTPIGFGPTFSSNSGIVSANLAAANAFTSLGTALGTSSVAVGTINSISVVIGSFIPQSLPIVTVIDENIAKLELPDGSGGIKGQNAIIVANNIPGAITEVTVENFGTRYNAADQVTVANLTRAGTTPGIGDPIISGFIENEGKYTDTKGFLSWDQKLQDNFYYQIFSYVIRSSDIGVKKYRDFVNNIVHPAGTKFFGQVDIEETFVFNDIDIESFVQIDLIGSANGVLSILSTVSIGELTLDMSLSANSVLSSLALGTSVIIPIIAPTSILTTANLADPNVLFVINPDEINSTESIPNNLVLNFNISANTLGFTSSIGNVTLGTFLEPVSITSTEIVSNNHSVAFVLAPISIESTIAFNGDSVNFNFNIPSITSSLALSTNSLFLLPGDGVVSVSNNNLITEFLGQPVTSYLDSPIVTLGSPFAVVGTNTFFTLTVSGGSIIEIQDNNPGIAGNTVYVVNTVFSNTSLSINTPYAGGGNLVSGIYRYAYI